jgi:hypothetical protein
LLILLSQEEQDMVTELLFLLIKSPLLNLVEMGFPFSQGIWKISPPCGQGNLLSSSLVLSMGVLVGLRVVVSKPQDRMGMLIGSQQQLAQKA